MTILITILVTILGYHGINKLVWKFAPEYLRYCAAFKALKIKHDCFNSNIYPGYRGIYIEDSRFDNITLYFDSKGKLQNK